MAEAIPMIPTAPTFGNVKFITIDRLKEMGFSHYKISRLVASGIIRPSNRTTYENLSYDGDENDFYSAAAFVPHGVICLMSAAKYYQLTDFLPDAVQVAIDRKKKVSTLPAWPEIKLFYFSPARIDLGVREIHEGDNSFRIYDLEKTVADIISYRNKVGIEETAEILRNFLRRKDCDLNRLHDYAKKLRCEKPLRNYLEVLIQ
ncbi:MAG: hypothetical protein IJS96_04420 [Schwartzia sp.]|nr:hypothetical protein [Schwartzia sp. (in: firmicutes)]